MSQVTVQDVLFAAKTLSVEDQKELDRLLVDHIRDTQRKANMEAALKFSRGDFVSFNHSKTGAKIYGTIKKFNPTRVIVESKYDKYGYAGRDIEWTVPASMLRKELTLPPAPHDGRPGLTQTARRLASELQELQSKEPKR